MKTKVGVKNNMIKKRNHRGRCKKCKTRISSLLRASFGGAEELKNMDMRASLSDYIGSPHYATLKKIHEELQEYRGYKDLVRRKKLSPVDFFVADPGFILEFDERQHFTIPRKIALSHYPGNIKLGFDKNLWMKLCEELDEHDNDSKVVFRDEQRAWYDTLRDFAPYILAGQFKLKPTKRILDADSKMKKVIGKKYREWCAISSSSPDDVKKFKQLIVK